MKLTGAMNQKNQKLEKFAFIIKEDNAIREINVGLCIQMRIILRRKKKILFAFFI
jgi:hypothetical protein